MLQLNPSKRPSVAKLLKDIFFISGKMTQQSDKCFLNVSCFFFNVSTIFIEELYF